MLRRRLVPLLLALPLAGCGSDDGASSVSFATPADGLAATCHPLRTFGACSVPFPSDVWLRADPGSATGFRVDLSAEAMPASAAGGPLDPTRWNEIDGFSPNTPILAYFPERLDPASLPGYDHLDSSLSPGSATLLLDLETKQLVAHFSELDVSANIEDFDRQPLLIHPVKHLSPSHHYAVAVTRSLRTLDGAVPTMPVGFERALRGARTQDATAKRVLDPLPAVLAAFEAAGTHRSELLVAWDFHTASLGAMIDHVAHMRDAALPLIGDKGMGYQIDTVDVDPDQDTHAHIQGHFTVPSFLTSDSRAEPDVTLHYGSDGQPAVRGNGEYNFDLLIPKSALSAGPLPLLVFGHGLLGEALDGPSGHVRGFCNSKGWLCIGTDFIGLSFTEAAGVGANAAALEAIKDVTKMKWLSDRLQQAIINTIALTRSARSILADPQTFVDRGAGPVTALKAPFEVAYYGISQGAIFGAGVMSYSPDLQRGVLQVGASGFSFFVQRSVDWNQFFPGIRNGYPDRVDQQVVIALWQPMLDYAEGAGTDWTQGANAAPPGITHKALLYQVGVGDCQVPNIGSEIQARTLGTPLLTPSAREVWGLDGTSGGGDTALVYWDLGRPPPPTTNATPDSDNDVHGDIRKLPENQQQTDTFLRTGVVQNTCTGACSFPGARP